MADTKDDFMAALAGVPDGCWVIPGWDVLRVVKALDAKPADSDLLRRLIVHGAQHTTGEDERITCTPEQAALAILDATGLDVEWAVTVAPAVPMLVDDDGTLAYKEARKVISALSTEMMATVDDGSECGASGKNLIDALSEAKVLDVIKLEDGRFKFVEQCDEYWSATLTKEQVMALAEELRTLASGARKSEGPNISLERTP